MLTLNVKADLSKNGIPQYRSVHARETIITWLMLYTRLSCLAVCIAHHVVYTRLAWLVNPNPNPNPTNPNSNPTKLATRYTSRPRLRTIPPVSNRSVYTPG